jgi:hypothetical protein
MSSGLRWLRWSGLALSSGLLAAAPRPIVVELFTSQGCNSCPPADALLGELTRQDDVLALAFHVQYWDGLGWSDRFGLPQAALRQQQYVRALSLGSGFTPQVVIDGRESQVGSNRVSINAGLRRQRAATRPGVNIGLRIEAGAIQVDVGTAADAALPATSVAEVVLVSYRARAETDIPRGENSGHKLAEFQIVRAIRLLGTWRGQALHYEIRPETVPPDATHLAVLLQQRDQGGFFGANSLVLHPARAD